MSINLYGIYLHEYKWVHLHLLMSLLNTGTVITIFSYYNTIDHVHEIKVKGHSTIPFQSSPVQCLQTPQQMAIPVCAA